jgi:hypothetical protein
MHKGVIRRGALTVGCETVPEGHELRLHISHGLMVCCASLPKEAVDLVNEDYSWLELVGKAEHSGNCRSNIISSTISAMNGGKKKRKCKHLILVTELLRIPEPLAHEIGYPDIDEDGPRLLGDGLGEHGLAGAGWAVQEHALLRAEEFAVGEELRAAQGQDDELVERLLDAVEAADGVELDVDVVGVDDVARDDVLKDWG